MPFAAGIVSARRPAGPFRQRATFRSRSSSAAPRRAPLTRLTGSAAVAATTADSPSSVAPGPPRICLPGAFVTSTSTHASCTSTRTRASVQHHHTHAHASSTSTSTQQQHQHEHRTRIHNSAALIRHAGVSKRAARYSQPPSFLLRPRALIAVRLHLSSAAAPLSPPLSRLLRPRALIAVE